MGDFEVKDEDLAGRIGYLTTAHGKLETPAFFPVINPLRNDLSINDILNTGIKNIITNAFILKKRDYIKDTIHKDLRLDNDIIVMMDSGGYQILQYGNVNITNSEIIKYQSKIKADIGVFLDVPTGDVENKHEALRTVEITMKRGEEAANLIRELDNKDTLWVHPIQGGKFLDLIEYSAKKANSLEEFSMLALGSPTVIMEKYNYDLLIDMIFAARANISRGKPLHLFGGGVPHIIPFAVAMGIDSFDSASYILYARDGRYLTRNRTYKIEDLEYFPCSCPVCTKYTPKELMEMDEDEQTRLLSLHNLYKILEEIKETKLAIKEGRLFEYLQEKAFSHPAVYSAFQNLLKYSLYLEKYDPRVKGEVKGIFLFDQYSMIRPEIVRYHQYMRKYKQSSDMAVIICGDFLEPPFISNEFIKDILVKYSNSADVFIAFPYYGLIPVTLSESFPLSQFEKPTNVPNYVYIETSNLINDIISKTKKYRKVILEMCENSKLHIMSISS
nr:tRNA guanosine(15) transglycosylase TgtA [Candidatus Acidianus copahuensis]